MPRPESPGLGGVLGCVVALVVWLVAVFAPRPLLSLELSLHGWLLEQRGPLKVEDAPRLVIVGQDDATYGWVAKHRNQAPGEWSREIYADVLERLRGLGARAVAFDFLFESEKAGTERFAEVLSRRDDTVLAVVLSQVGDARRGASSQALIRPQEALAAHAGQGAISTPVGRDGRVRWYLEHIAGLSEEPLPSLAVALGRRVDAGRVEASLAGASRDESGAFLLNFRDASPAFPVFSMMDLLDPDGALAQAYRPSLPADLGSRRVVAGPLGRGPGVIEVAVEPPDVAVEALALPEGLAPWSAAEGSGTLRLEGLGEGPFTVYLARDLGGGAFGVWTKDGVRPGGPPLQVSLPPPVEGMTGQVENHREGVEVELVGAGIPVGDGFYQEVLPVVPGADGSFATPAAAEDMFRIFVAGREVGVGFRGEAVAADAASASGAWPEGELLVRDAAPGMVARPVDPALPRPPYVTGDPLEQTSFGGRLRLPQPRGPFRLLLTAADGRRGVALADAGNPFRDALVLVGPTSKLDQDFQATPMGAGEEDGGGLMPGVEVHAHALWTLLTGEVLRTPAGLGALGGSFGRRLRGLWGYLALLLVLCGGAGVAIRWAMPRGGILILIVAGVAWVLFAIAQFVDLRAWWPVASPLVALTLTYVLVLWVNYVTVEAKRRQIRETFQHYLDPDIVRQLEADPEALQLGGDQQEVTCFFSDIEGFSSFSEIMEPPELVDFINEYLTAMSDTLIRYGGWLDKFIGDAIVAVFNAPRSQPDHAILCVRAALEMKQREVELREEWSARGLPQVKTRIGINTGMAVVGNVGTGNRKNYTILGDAVNLAARLEALNKSYGTYLMVGENTHNAVGGHFESRELDLVRVKGKKIPAAVFEVVAERGQAGEDFQKAREAWELAVGAYRNQRWTDAEKHFERVLRHLPGDPPSKMYLERMKLLRKVPPPEDWDGVWTMEHK